MSDDAMREINEFREMVDEMDTAETVQGRLQFALIAKGLAMQQAGLIPMEMEISALVEKIAQVNTESLRLSRH